MGMSSNVFHEGSQKRRDLGGGDLGALQERQAALSSDPRKRRVLGETRRYDESGWE